MTYKIKLQPGDYCRDMGEDKYREVAQRFFDDGCPEGEQVGTYEKMKYFGWERPEQFNNFFHGDNKDTFGGRELTYEQIMEKEPMTDDIWKDAPEGATHYSQDNQLFYKKKDRSLYFWRLNWVESDYDSDEYHFLKLIPLPTQDWQKNNEMPIGLYELPPLGKYEITHNGHKGIWRGVEILKYEYDPSDHEYPRAAVKHLYGGDESFTAGCLYWVYGLNDDDFEFRPIKSDREKAIEEMVQIMIKGNGSKFGDCAKNLYDAGYRKVE